MYKRQYLKMGTPVNSPTYEPGAESEQLIPPRATFGRLIKNYVV